MTPIFLLKCASVTCPGSQINTCLCQLGDPSVDRLASMQAAPSERERETQRERGRLCNLKLSRTMVSRGFITLQATVPTQSTACSENGFYNSPKSNTDKCGIFTAGHTLAKQKGSAVSHCLFMNFATYPCETKSNITYRAVPCAWLDNPPHKST